MKWEKQGQIQIAQGKYGNFTIQKSGAFYIAKYYGDINFTLPYKRSIKVLKKMCKENWYWEE